MELKKYQLQVINDLDRFLELLIEKQNISKAYNALWNEKGINVGIDGMPPYNPELAGVPQVCFKVPTGGGKTFLAANSLKPIFASMPHIHPKAVVWLVPSDAILSQTYKTLTDMDNYVYQNKKEDKHKELIETLQNITDIFLSLLSVIDSIKFHSSDYLDALEMEMKPQEGSQYWVCPIIVEYMNDRFDKKLLQYIQNNEGNGMQFMAEYYNQNKG